MAEVITPPVDEFAGFEDAPVDEFAGFEDAPIPGDVFSNFPDADDLDVRSVEDLNADRNTFSPKEYYAANPNVASDPAKLAKLLDVYRRRDKEGLDAAQVAKSAVTEALPTAGKILGGVRDLAKAGIELSVQPLVTAAGAIFTGDIFSRQRSEALFEEQRNRMKKAVAEGAAASELSATGLADLARTGLRKFASRDSSLGLQGTGLSKEDVTGEPKPEKTDQELLQQLASDVEFGKQLSEIAQGRGETAKAIGLDAETLSKEGIELRPEVIERLSLVDPLTIVGTGGLFMGVTGAGKTVFTAASRAAAQKMVDRLGAAAAKAATAPLRAAGSAAELTGAVTKKISPFLSTAGTVAGVVSGDFSSAASGYIAGQAARRVLPKVGTALEASGRAAKNVANTVANSTTFQKALVGAAEGGAAAAPFVAATDDDKTAGAILGAGIGLGAGVGGVIGAKQGVAQRVSNRQLVPKDIAYPPTESKGYGLNENLDVAHAEAIQTLPQSSQNTINSFRESVRELGGEVYVLDPEFFEQSLLELAERSKGEALTGPESTAVRAQAADQGGYFDATLPGPDGQSRRAIFLNNSGNPVAHETGHLFHSLLSPERQADLAATARQVYTPEQISQFKANYEQRFGQAISEDRAINELVADNFSQLFQNTPISEISTPAPLLTKIGQQITGAAESLGLDLTAGVRTEMGTPSSLRFNNVLRDTAREILQPGSRPPTVEPITPAAPARPEPISLTEAAQTLSALPEPAPEIPVVRRAEPASTQTAARRPKLAVEPAKPVEVAAAAEARTIADEAPTGIPVGGTKSPRELLGTIAESIANQEGVKINYLSAPDEPAAAISSNRDIRRAIIELNRDSPPARRKLWEKNFVPDKVIKTKAGKYQIQGLAPEVFASNAHKMAKFMSEVPDAGLLSPYPIDPKTKTFTEAGWQQLFDAAQTVSHNHARGYTGTGEQLVVPRSVTEAGGYAPPIKGDPKPLPQAEADFVNLLLNFRLPDTPRITAGKRPLNIQGQDISAATKPGRIRKPVQAREKFSGPEAESQNIVGREILEVNPLRNQLEQAAQNAGVAMPSLIEAIQRLNLERIKEVVGTPEQPALRANTLTASAGFQPKLTADKVAGFSPDEFRAWAAMQPGGFTRTAWDVGLAAPDRPFVDSLKTRADEFGDRVEKARVNLRTGDMATMIQRLEDMQILAMQTQFFTEAHEAAVGIGSAVKRLLEENPNYVPPFPQMTP